MGDKFDLLLTYSPRDRAIVLALAQQIRAAGVRVWLDVWEVVPGTNSEVALKSAIASCKAMAVFLSGQSSSDWADREVQAGIAGGLRLIPVLLSGAHVPTTLAAYAAVDLSFDDDTLLLEQLNRLITTAGGQAIGTTQQTNAPRGILHFLKGLTQKAERKGVAAAPIAKPEPGVNKSSAVEQSLNIIRGEYVELDTVIALVRQLKALKEMGVARQLLARARADGTTGPIAPARKLWLAQQHALCTYKDPHLSDDKKFDQAISILNGADDLLTSNNQETLGLAGAIHKYRWEALGQLSDLELSSVYYLRGYALGPETDLGYTSINAAYVLDLLANKEESFARQAGGVSLLGEQRRRLAREIRQRLVQILPELVSSPGNEYLSNTWWFLVTVAEAYFGLGEEHLEEARVWLERAKNQSAVVDDWEFESTVRQLANVARILAEAQLPIEPVEETEAARLLRTFVGNSAAVESALLGRVGLALSGGGFRASLYHIGVLAKLAELDALRHVEVLSCVSGGSVIGTHYFLELQHLLQSKTDDEISREDYIAVVRRIERDFLAGVKRNIRTRVVINPITNLKMLLFPNFSRSERVAELYEKEFFSRVRDGKGKKPRCLRQLMVAPKGHSGSFSPKHDNWRRRTKVPMIVLNATSLNTGHNWQFTATYMGEPPGAIDSEIDGNCRLRRMYYSEAPKGYADMRLGRAVAASASVPGLFDPITLKDLYPDTIVRLVDGGVHDNQGISALLEQGCSVLLVSDASGQMGVEDTPGNSSLSSLLRSSSVMGARIRGAEYRDLESRRRSSQLRGLMFIHLKQDLESDPKNWIGCDDPVESSEEARPGFRRGVLTTYSIRKDVQRLIADIRTDLDSFHEVEAYSLMTSGYRMTETAFTRDIRGFPKVPAISPDWMFLAIEGPMNRAKGFEDAYGRLKELLTVSSVNALKVWRLVPVLLWSGSIVLLIAVIGLIAFALLGPPIELLTLRSVVIAVTAAVLTALLGKWPVMAVRYRASIRRYLVGFALCLVGLLAGALHLWIFDRWYLRLGKAERLLALRNENPVP
jgi:predicted acylesterase/phospholipase RssA